MDEPEQHRNLLAKLDRRLIPFLLLMYVLAFLDRTNVGFAREGFQQDTGLSDAAYAFGASIFFLGYAVFEVPSNIILARVGARLWMARIMVTWGLVSAAMMFAHTEELFYALRFLLGVCEAGFFPGVLYYLTTWYPPEARGRAMGLFYFGAPLTFIIGGPLSGLLLDMDGIGGLQGWQWLFLIDGLAASVVGFIAYFYLDDRPREARWLSVSEKATLAQMLGEAPSGASHPQLFKLLSALGEGRVLLLAVIYMLIQISVYGVIFFLPTQIATLLGTTVGLEVGVVSAIPWIAALAAAWYVPRLSDRTGARRQIAAAALAAAALGIAASAMVGSPVLGLLALSVAASGFIAAQPVFWTIAATVLGSARAAAGIAFINSIGALGAFLAPNLRVFAEQMTGSPHAGLMVLAALTLLSALLVLLARGGADA